MIRLLPPFGFHDHSSRESDLDRVIASHECVNHYALATGEQAKALSW